MIYGAIAASEIRPPIRASIRFAGTGSFQPINVIMGKLASANFTGLGALSVTGTLENPVKQGSVSFAGIGQMAAAAYIPATGTKFDPATASAKVSITNDDLTATHTDTTDNQGAKSTTSHATGKYYWEVTCGHATGNWTCIGGMLSTASYTDLVSNSTNCFELYHNDTNSVIWCNGGSSGYGLGHFTDGDIISVAIDTDAAKLWMRKNGGLWNGNGTADPVGGVNAAALGITGTWFAAVGFGSTGTTAGENFTVNFGGSAYSYTPPSGFGDW